MGLHHFSWAGKERTVSVDRSHRGKITLQFIDAEINEKLVGKLVVFKDQPFSEIGKFVDPGKQKLLLQLMQDLQERIGPIIRLDL